jgi:maltose-binding protein MalE
MKKFFLIITLVILSVGIQAEAYSYLTFRPNTGNSDVSLSVEGLKITFANGKLVATNSSTTQSFTLTEIASMYFSDTSTGAVNEVNIGSSSVSVEGGKIVVTAPQGSVVNIYNIAGASVGNFVASGSKDTYDSNLSQGVYLVKVNGKTSKLLVR